jgi:hypothetical protein
MRINYSFLSGAGRLGCFLVVIILCLLWTGGQRLYIAVTNRTPMIMSYDDYVQIKPSAHWLRLTNCMLNLGEASYKTIAGSKRPTEIYIPVQSSASDAGKVYVLVATKNQDLITTFMEMQNLQSKAEALAWALKNRDRIHSQRGVTGLVRFGIDMKDKERRKLAKLHENIADDFIIVDEGERPNLTEGLGFLGGGIVLLVGVVLFQRRSGEVTTADI